MPKKPHSILVRQSAVLAAALSLIGCAGGPSGAHSFNIRAGAHYVSMGSSFAAGPGVGQVVADAPQRCGRSQLNYAQQLATRRGFQLTDVSCNGAKTDHVLAPWRELPAQIEALSDETALVTVTIGGNDLDYMRFLFGAYCRANPAAADPECNPPALPSDQAYEQVEKGLRTIANEVRKRAPTARLIFVDYLTVLPDATTCALTPLNDQDADSSRLTARRLAAITEQVAKDTGSEVIKASSMSQGHDACSDYPWMNGWPNPGNFAPQPGGLTVVPYHPNLAGMTAIADALDELLSH